MPSTLSQQLTNQFYEWEKLGRGWTLFETPVDLEPDFVPFSTHTTLPTRFTDTGKKTVISFLTDFFGIPTATKPQTESEPAYEPPAVGGYTYDRVTSLKTYCVSLPKDFKVNVDESAQLLTMLSYCKHIVSFEIIATAESITVQFVCSEFDAAQVSSQIKAFFPKSIVDERDDTLFDLILKSKFASVRDFGLKEEFMRPLPMPKSFTLDPFVGLFGIFENLHDGELGMIQILFSGAINPWAPSIIRSVTGQKGESFFENAPEMPKLALEKTSSPLFAVTIRVLAGGDTAANADLIFKKVANALLQNSISDSNSLIPLLDKEYDFDTSVEDIALRQSHRVGMLLSCNELVNFVHFPSSSVASNKLERDIKRTKAAPSITEGHQFKLGINYHQGKEKLVSLSAAQRLKHTHIIGATGTGKSTFLLNSIIQDIEQGNGIAVLDPHGDLIESILSYIPENRIDDVLILDPADSEFPVGFNILSAHSEIEKEILSSDLVAVFRRLSTSWGDQMNSVFANAIIAFLESDQGGTLADLRRFLVEKSYRDQYLKTVKDSNIVYYWQKEFPILRSGSIGSILTRLDTFLRPKLIRNMVAQKKGLDFERILDTQKILLVKLSQGLIGNENSYLLGTFVVSKIYQAAMARQAQAKEARSDFFLYIDEFQNFITPSMSAILSGARKYHVGLILAHQDMQQLMKQDSELVSSVMSNAGTRICFRIGDADAKRFADGFSFFEAQDLQNLNTGEAIARIDRPEYDLSFTSIAPPKPENKEDLTDTIISRSREKYGTPKQEVESLLKESRQEIEEYTPVEKVEEKKPEEKPKAQTTTPRVEVNPISEETQASTTEKLVQQKEQTEHRYLQSFIKRLAEARGYRTTLEEPTPDGKGRVDVSLERNGKRIAVEISVTTETEWEIHNIKKCINAGYNTVIECSSDKKILEKIKRKIESSGEGNLFSKVLFLDPETFVEFLNQEVTKEASTEATVKGFRVKVEYNAVSEKDMSKKREAIAREVLNSIKKTKK